MKIVRLIGEQVEELAVKIRVVPLGVTIVCYAEVTNIFYKRMPLVQQTLMTLVVFRCDYPVVARLAK